MSFLQSFIKINRPILGLFFVSLTLFTVSRVLLIIWQFDRVGDASAVTQLMFGGFRIDLSSFAYLAIPIFLLMLLSVFISRTTAIFNGFYRLCFTGVVALMVLCEAATPAFINQYDIRPNRLFIEYLEYPKEVTSMLLHGHLLTLILSLFVVMLTTFYAYKFAPKFYLAKSNVKQLTGLSKALIAFITLVLLVGLGRGTLQHRPINPALVYFSNDSLVNSLALNSPYSIAFAIKNMADEKSAATLYGKMPDQQIIEQVVNESYLPAQAYQSKALPTLAFHDAFNQGKRKNLVIILEESLGARFVGKLGGSGITPKLDSLMEQGWAFEHLYATGTRSVRGIEAVVTGFLPSPSRSVVKLSKSQKDFFTLASLLANQGYFTQFIYGGESHFDNMKSFFLGNGFENIVDFKDIDNPQFVTSWGASDEDLFNQANIELNKLHQADKPFFSLIFSSSNHDPFAIPDGKVSLSPDHQTDNPARDLAIKYADMAVGNFIETAKSQAYWQDTVFLIVADHDVRVFGSEPVPIKSFHIPAVILNSGYPQQMDPRLVSQIDLPVTMLSLIGIAAQHPMPGFDLTKQYPVERAMMQFYDNFAYIENEQVAILSPGDKTSYWHYDKQTKRQDPLAEELLALKQKALAHVLFSNMAYQKAIYRLEN